ncbi:9654_t:CDS:1, partial [Acaulospora morrowiae]
AIKIIKKSINIKRNNHRNNCLPKLPPIATAALQRISNDPPSIKDFKKLLKILIKEKLS